MFGLIFESFYFGLFLDLLYMYEYFACMYVYVHIYVYICVCVYMYMHLIPLEAGRGQLIPWNGSFQVVVYELQYGS